MLEIVQEICTCAVIPCADRHMVMHYQALSPTLSPCYSLISCQDLPHTVLQLLGFFLIRPSTADVIVGVPSVYVGWGTFSKYVPLGRSLGCVLGTLNDVRCANESSRSPTWAKLSRGSQMQDDLSSLCSWFHSSFQPLSLFLPAHQCFKGFNNIYPTYCQRQKSDNDFLKENATIKKHLEINT